MFITLLNTFSKTLKNTNGKARKTVQKIGICLEGFQLRFDLWHTE